MDGFCAQPTPTYVKAPPRARVAKAITDVLAPRPLAAAAAKPGTPHHSGISRTCVNDGPARRTSAPYPRGRLSARSRLRPVVWGWLALLALAAAWGTKGCDQAGGQDTGGRVAVGRDCRSTLEQGLELSCGTYGFGDLRYVCRTTDTRSHRCLRTTTVTVRNTGRSAVVVTVIKGPRQGTREQSREQALAPGESAVLRPGKREFLFDVTLRNTRSTPGSLLVTRVQ